MAVDAVTKARQKKMLACAKRSGNILSRFGLWLSLVERSVRDREVAGSNPVNPTIWIEAVGIAGGFFHVSAACLRGLHACVDAVPARVLKSCEPRGAGFQIMS